MFTAKLKEIIMRRNKLGDFMTIVIVIAGVLTTIVFFTAAISAALCHRAAVTTKDNGIKTIEYGQEIAFDEAAPEVSDIVFVLDKDTDADTDVHYYRVDAIDEYEAFAEYKCTDDMGNERVLNRASDGIYRVLKEGTFEHFMVIHGAALFAVTLGICVLAIGIFILSQKLHR